MNSDNSCPCCSACASSVRPLPAINPTPTFRWEHTVICDTQKQMERFVVLFDGDYSSAMNKVNAEENNPTACIGATMAYVQGNELSKAKGFKGTYNIIRVLVLGITTADGLPADSAGGVLLDREERRDRDVIRSRLTGRSAENHPH